METSRDLSKLPAVYVTLETIELHNEERDVIDILQSVDDYYALFSESVVLGPYKSQEELLKKIIRTIATNSDRLLKSIKKIEDIVCELYSGA